MAAATNGPRVIIITKKAKGHGGHHGGAWKVAYADFVTAMMALFMVMWLLSQTDKETKEQLSEYFRTGVFSGAPSVLNGGSGIQQRAYFDVVGSSPTNVEQAALERIAMAVRTQLNNAAAKDADLRELTRKIKVTVTEDGLLIQILDDTEDVLFDRSSAELKPKLVFILQKIAPLLARLDNKIQVHGHTDARPFANGSGRTNWQLSFDRADRARAVLEKSGLREGQVSGVHAFGASVLYNPRDPNAPENRRLAILAVRQVKEQPAIKKPSAAPKEQPQTKPPEPARGSPEE